jgi:hypothetical protein
MSLNKYFYTKNILHKLHIKLRKRKRIRRWDGRATLRRIKQQDKHYLLIESWHPLEQFGLVCTLIWKNVAKVVNSTRKISPKGNVYDNQLISDDLCITDLLLSPSRN